MTPFLGQIDYFAATRIPKYWAQCNGQLLPINTNQALFSLLGTTYGGNGTTTFGLPNLQGRIPIGAGAGYALGAVGGEETHTLTPAEIPSHNHSFNGTSNPGTGNQPVPSQSRSLASAVDLQNGNAPVNLYSTSSSNGTLAGQSISPAGNQPHENRMPYCTMVACIAIQGIYPSRN